MTLDRRPELNHLEHWQALKCNDQPSTCTNGLLLTWTRVTTSDCAASACERFIWGKSCASAVWQLQQHLT